MGDADGGVPLVRREAQLLRLMAYGGWRRVEGGGERQFLEDRGPRKR